MEDSFTTAAESAKKDPKKRHTANEDVKVKRVVKVRSCKAIPSLYELYFDGGGQLPASLEGKYTRPDWAQREADKYNNEA